jgi:copper chaperone CopZ
MFLMRKILSLATGFVLLLASFAAAADPVKTSLNIEGMTCGGCAAAVKLQLKRAEGVTAYEVSYESKRAEVTYDPARTSPQKIADAVAQTGYQVTVVGGPPPAAPSANTAMPGVRPDGLRDWFNENIGSVRVVSILSPTCSQCRAGHGVLKAVFDKSSSAELKAFLVWLPIRANDDAREATQQTSMFRDGRLNEGWDADRAVGDLFARRLSLRGAAWDVYLVYDRGVRWEGADPPMPSFWMHQLEQSVGADQKLCLNPTRFTGEVIKRLERRH